MSLWRRLLGFRKKDSVMIRRMVLLLIFTILLSSTLTSLFYSLTSNMVFSDMAVRDYTNKASYLARQTAAYQAGELTPLQYVAMLKSSPDLMSASVLVYSDQKLYSVQQHETSLLDEQMQDEIIDFVQNYFKTRQGRGLSMNHVLLGKKKADHLMVLYPVLHPDPSGGEDLDRGLVVIVKSFSEIKAGHESLKFALIVASTLAFLLMLLPALLAIFRLLKPMKEVGQVAKAMAEGNFSVRAKDHYPGEFGELAYCINDLASALDQSMNALLLERNRLQQILDGISEGILAVNANLNITHFNPSISELLRPPVEEDFQTQGLTQKQTWQEDFAELEKLFRHSPYALDVDYKRCIEQRMDVEKTFQHGERILAMHLSPVIDNRDCVVAAVGLFRDITASEKLEQTRRDYVANISHELRTPLTALRGLIEPLNDGLVRDDEDRLRYYGIILNETLRLSRLIDDMLELSRLQAGKTKVAKFVFDLAEIFDNLEAKYQHLAKQKQLHLSFPPRSDALMAYGNADRYEQILTILIDNALKFTPEHGTIRLSIMDCKKHYEISVQDSGAGIPEGDVAHVFERFYKADKARGKSGTGLGLSIAKEIMQAMNERIWLESKLGEGTRFTITLEKAQEEP